MSQAVRVLQVVGRLNIGGAESRIMDLYRNIDRDKVQFDFVQHMTEKGAYQDEAESLGAHIYCMPRFRLYNYFSYKKSWERFFKEHSEIQIVHGHMTSTAAIYLPIAKKYCDAYTIAHARSAGVDKGIKGYVTKFLRKGLACKCDSCFSCSDLASEAVFGKKNIGKVKFIPNAIDTEKFRYDINIRRRIRAEWGISEKDLVIGHVGRFDLVKNHAYMLEILSECLKRNRSVKLFLVGDGPLRDDIKLKADKLGVDAHVIFAGRQRDVYNYYQAFDFFIFPSFYEGLPGTAIEAQASGLHGILSDRITRQAAVTDLIKFKSIDVPAREWADEIFNTDISGRRSRSDDVRNAGFDIKEQAKKMSEFYYENSVSHK